MMKVAVIVGIIAGCLLAAIPGAHASNGKGGCEYLIVTVVPRGFLPKLVATEPNYGQALKELRILTAEGWNVRLGSIC